MRKKILNQRNENLKINYESANRKLEKSLRISESKILKKDYESANRKLENRLRISETKT